MEELSKHERRKLRKQKAKEERMLREETALRKQKTKKFLVYSVSAVFVIGFIYLIVLTTTNQPTKNYNIEGLTFPMHNVHLHATPIIKICGETKQIPVAPVIDHLLHTHEDRLIHIEGTVNSPNQITLGEFFRKIGVKFSETEIMEKKNGGLCNGKEAKVSMKINGIENTEFENHIIRENETIEIAFE